MNILHNSYDIQKAMELFKFVYFPLYWSLLCSTLWLYSFYCWLKIPVCFIFFLYFCYICTNQTCNNVKICHNKYIFVQFDFPSVLSVSSMFPLFNPSFLLFFLSPFSFLRYPHNAFQAVLKLTVDQGGFVFCILLLWHPYCTTTPSSMLLKSVNYLISF